MTNGRTLVMSSYFTKNRHPQYYPNCSGIGGLISSGDKIGYVKKDNINYCQKWIKSLSKFDVESLIFYDDLSDKFVKDMMCLSKNLTFVKVPKDITCLSSNDQRFYIYLDYLFKQDNVSKVFMTDLWDVECKTDPSKMPTEEFDLYFCQDSINVKDYKFDKYSYREISNSLNWKRVDLESCLFNAGVIGGSFYQILKFLILFTHERDSVRDFPIVKKCKYNINMSLSNYIAKSFFDKVQSGYPFCSVFKKFENRDDVYFVHK